MKLTLLLLLLRMLLVGKLVTLWQSVANTAYAAFIRPSAHTATAFRFAIIRYPFISFNYSLSYSLNTNLGNNLPKILQ